MINQLLPEQIASMWEVISYAIERAVPPIAEGAPDRSSRLLSMLLAGKMHCWAVSHRRDDGSVQLEAVVVTQILEDEGSGTRSLLIYSLYGYSPITQWQEGLDALATWARRQRCSRLIAYTNTRAVLEAVARLGWNTDYTLITYSLNAVHSK